jgi:protein gp37
MSGDTTIEWAEKVWNPVRGCSRTSPGCKNCYAERVAWRFGQKEGQPYHGLVEMTSQGPKWTGQLRTVPHAIDEPLHVRKAARWFVNSMSDLFHESVPFSYIDQVFATMKMARHHTFQVLTKRAARMREYLTASFTPSSVPPNVWLGVSVEDQQRADERIPELVGTPAAVRFLSVEPMLGPITIDEQLIRMIDGTSQHGQRFIDWVITGFESGPGARPGHPQWARDLRDQCSAAGVPYFFKQWGEWAPAEQVNDSTLLPGERYAAVHASGDEPVIYGSKAFAHPNPERALMVRVGKFNAGRQLDGRTHDAYPAAAAHTTTTTQRGDE